MSVYLHRLKVNPVTLRMAKTYGVLAGLSAKGLIYLYTKHCLPNIAYAEMDLSRANFRNKPPLLSCVKILKWFCFFFPFNFIVFRKKINHSKYLIIFIEGVQIYLFDT